MLPRLEITPEDGDLTRNLSILHVYCLFRKGQEFSVMIQEIEGMGTDQRSLYSRGYAQGRCMAPGRGF